jgi:hypothetical protein
MTPMILPQAFEAEAQRAPVLIAPYVPERYTSGGLLDNAVLQSGTHWTPVLLHTMQPAASPRSRLEWSKRHRFDPAGKAKRIARSLRALAEPVLPDLSAEQWQQVAESADAEAQF